MIVNRAVLQLDMVHITLLIKFVKNLIKNSGKISYKNEESRFN